MAPVVKRIIMGAVLIICILNSLGCAAAWFLAGAGTAATAIAVSDSKSGDTETKEDE